MAGSPSPGRSGATPPRRAAGRPGRATRPSAALGGAPRRPSAATPPGWAVPRRDVHDVLADLFARFEVVRLFADPWGWRDELDGWAQRYGEGVVLALPT